MMLRCALTALLLAASLLPAASFLPAAARLLTDGLLPASVLLRADDPAPANLLPAFSQARNDGRDDILALYRAEIEWTAALTDAWDAYYLEADLNGDGAPEILSYFISAVNSGSAGNFRLDIWQADGGGAYRNLAPDNTLWLNSRMEHPPAAAFGLYRLPEQPDGWTVLEYRFPRQDGQIYRLQFRPDGRGGYTTVE